ncbi:tyrosine-type recombinase/integrase [Enterococcus rivorum]|uniref:tyrosine-type recombinase/integrase n=1 Tax=Enterococcus rivorum TaxID=762845 RepID=UPI00362F1995
MYLKETTYSKYYRIIRNHIAPYFYNCPLYKLSERHCTDFLHLLLEKGMSAGSIRNIFNLLRKALNAAVREGYIENNPCKNIILPKLLKKEVRALSRKEHLEIETIALSEKECSPIIVALYTGMRIGELSGLRWTDIDFEENTLSVRQTVTRISVNDLEKKTKILITKPKTATSYRKIPLAENLKQYLIEKKSNSTSAFVFSYKGQIMEPRLINYRFKAILKKASLEGIHFHMLRHSFATRAIETGIDIVTLSKILGHSSTKMTLDTYAYSIYDNRVTAMDKIDQLMISIKQTEATK